MAVVGRPYRRTGEQVVAFVTGADLSVEAVNEHCADRLAKFKRPSLVQIVDDLPRGSPARSERRPADTLGSGQ